MRHLVVPLRAVVALALGGSLVALLMYSAGGVFDPQPVQAAKPPTHTPGPTSTPAPATATAAASATSVPPTATAAASATLVPPTATAAGPSATPGACTVNLATAP